MQRGAAQQAIPGATAHVQASPSTVPGLEFARVFTREGVDPFDEV